MNLIYHYNAPEWITVAGIACHMLTEARSRYPTWGQSWTDDEHCQYLESILMDDCDQWILVAVDDKTEEVTSMAIVSGDLDAHIGPGFSVLANFNRTEKPDLKFQRFVHRFIHDLSRQAGRPYYCYTHMLPDGTGCVTHHMKVPDEKQTRP